MNIMLLLPQKRLGAVLLLLYVLLLFKIKVIADIFTTVLQYWTIYNTPLETLSWQLVLLIETSFQLILFYCRYKNGLMQVRSFGERESPH